ncbi:MAG: plasmid stabilization protein [Alphaproteobacteria bacterium]|nr:plasmid stabilization protein [Alphaproteobacteria bacterium]
MASIIIRNLDPAVKAKLRMHAARQGRSMEDAAREILRTALAERTRGGVNMADAIRRRFDPLGGVDIELPPRDSLREPPRVTK